MLILPQANVGELDEKTSRYGILFGNMALLQVQATLVSFIAAILSFVLGTIMPDPHSPATSADMVMLFSRRPHPKIPHNSTKPKSGIIE